MNRESFLNLSSRAALFFGSAPSLLACKVNAEHKIDLEKANDLLLAKNVLGTNVNLKVDPINKVRVGMLGMGNRGSVLIQMFEYLIKNDFAEIVALSDLKEDKLKKNNALDTNLYDSVLWSALTPLSQLSVANNSASTKIPDFTGGTWGTPRKNEVLRDII